jgi:hypothetical protein
MIRYMIHASVFAILSWQCAYASPRPCSNDPCRVPRLSSEQIPKPTADSVGVLLAGGGIPGSKTRPQLQPNMEGTTDVKTTGRIESREGKLVAGGGIPGTKSRPKLHPTSDATEAQATDARGVKLIAGVCSVPSCRPRPRAH